MRIFLWLGLAFLVPTPLLAQTDDRATYEQIVERMEGGQSYYEAAAIELRDGNFPLRPALAFRPPTLAWTLSWLPDTPTRLAALFALLICAVIAWARSLEDLSTRHRLSLVAMLMCGLASVAGHAQSVYLHESWAIVMMTFSLALYRKLWFSAACAFFAVLLRETALAFIAATAAVALLQHDFRRVAAMCAIAASAIALWLYHSSMVAGVVLPGDPASPGWLRFEGPSLVFAAARWNLLTVGLPNIILVPGLAAMAIGLSLVRKPELQVAATSCLLFSLALLVVGRPDNSYWGIMFAPFLGLGLPALAERLIRSNLPAKT